MRKWILTAGRATLFLLTCIFSGMLLAQPLVDFPTDNRELLNGRPERFYMYVDRDFQGKKTKPWEGGQYGYVRGPKMGPSGVYFTAFHEGVDIRPLRRDSQGEPLDTVRAVAEGRVVHVNDKPGASNYGRYIVVEHIMDGSPFYSLYAHLASTDVKVGDRVRQGAHLGRMGYTGAGINKERAHVHLEFCFLLNRNFQKWYDAHIKDSPNLHGIYNGRNLAGMPVDKLLLEAQKNPTLKISSFARSQEAFFTLVIPNSPHFDLLRLYPWLAGASAGANPPAWAVSFTQYGTPVRAEPHGARITEPYVSWVKPSAVAYSHLTRGLITGTAQAPRLTDSGRRFVKLLVAGG